MDKEEVKVLAAALIEEMESVHDAEMAWKWEDGSVFFMPGDSDTKEHEIPIKRMMHKIVMIRDNLRVLESKINTSKEISDSEKLRLQNYITKCYGSLTSFNFLFYSDEDKFKSK
jgi:hypothetical protein